MTTNSAILLSKSIKNYLSISEISMEEFDTLINQIAQDKIEFNQGSSFILNHANFEFELVFTLLRNYIVNSIPEKVNYTTDTYIQAIASIPLKPTLTPVVILKSFPTKIAFNKLEILRKDEQQKTIIALLWIFKQTDTQRRNTECKNGCGHDWHNI
ncbi:MULTISPECIES: DUF5958 family protein [Sphingobacterium]|uniref:DUF5958 family protein n=1 Tax=Sphingobacterium TaxID=28453 RepID=UPI00104C3A23|nr:MULTISPECIES: DUF5958 family protein [Sphingobacterium]MCW2259665.1 hypothetical protein [Sphingobacterium kitahiroshimense]TCR13899.1 hypothetical protein EDF67_1012 [Sphingobacterium sp. JUb78]